MAEHNLQEIGAEEGKAGWLSSDGVPLNIQFVVVPKAKFVIAIHV